MTDMFPTEYQLNSDAQGQSKKKYIGKFIHNFNNFLFSFCSFKLANLFQAAHIMGRIPTVKAKKDSQ